MKRSNVDRIYEAIRKVNQVYDIWASSHGLTMYEMEIYYEILKTDEMTMTQKDLCQRLEAPKTSINSIIKKQLQNGYIELHTNPQNKREKRISLTPKGQEFAKNLIQPLFRYEEEAVAMLAEEEIEAVITAQNKFADILLEKIEKNQ